MPCSAVDTTVKAEPCKPTGGENGTAVRPPHQLHQLQHHVRQAR